MTFGWNAGSVPLRTMRLQQFQANQSCTLRFVLSWPAHRPLYMQHILHRLCHPHHIGCVVSSDTTECSGLPCMHA